MPTTASSIPDENGIVMANTGAPGAALSAPKNGDDSDSEIEWEEDELAALSSSESEVVLEEDDLVLNMSSEAVRAAEVGTMSSGAANSSSDPASKKRKTAKPWSFFRSHVEAAMKTHLTYLNRWTRRCKRDSMACSNDFLMNLLMSMLPGGLLASCQELLQVSRSVDICEQFTFILNQKSLAGQINKWLQTKFYVQHEDVDNARVTDLTDPESLVNVILNKHEDFKVKVTMNQMSCIAVALYRAIGFPARLVYALCGPSLKPSDHADLMRDTIKLHKAKKLVAQDLDEEAVMSTWREKKGRNSAAGQQRSWVEVYINTASNRKSLPTGKSVKEVISLLDYDEVAGETTSSSSWAASSASKNASKEEAAAEGSGWKHLDPISGTMDAPWDALKLCKIKRPTGTAGTSSQKQLLKTSYIVACDEVGHCVDVLNRYDASPQRRAVGSDGFARQYWSGKLLVRISTPCEPSSSFSSGNRGLGMGHLNFDTVLSPSVRAQNEEARARLEVDQRELQKLEKEHAAVKPTSLAGFKSSPHWVLNNDKCLNKDEALLPDATVQGVFRGTAIYLRKDVVRLLPAKKWCQLETRQVLESEKDSPIKYIERTARHDKSKYKVGLYGKWQTHPIKVPPIKDNVLPANEYGNMEIWDYNENLVPNGAKLMSNKELDVNALRKVCKEMALPYLDAVVSFENYQGRTTPKVGGIVVLDAHYDILLEAGSNVEAHQLQQKVDLKKRDMVKRWKKIVQGVLNLDRLRRQYGNNNNSKRQ